MNAAKEGNTENQADRFDDELWRPIQMNMENHRYVLDSPAGPLVISPTNLVEEGSSRQYHDHYRGKKFSASVKDERAVGLSDLPPIAEQPYTNTVRALGDALKSSFVQASKKDVHFFSKHC